MRPYHPSDGGADPGREKAPAEVAAQAEWIAKLMAEGRKCEKCGREKQAHSRLKGWFCLQCG